MNVETTLETNAQFSEAGKPGMRVLDHPVMSVEALLLSTPRRAIRAVMPSCLSYVVAIGRLPPGYVLAGVARRNNDNCTFARCFINNTLHCLRARVFPSQTQIDDRCGIGVDLGTGNCSTSGPRDTVRYIGHRTATAGR